MIKLRVRQVLVKFLLEYHVPRPKCNFLGKFILMLSVVREGFQVHAYNQISLQAQMPLLIVLKRDLNHFFFVLYKCTTKDDMLNVAT